MSASAHRYSCDELGACQTRLVPCAGCKQPHPQPFAPGVIERHQPTRHETLRRRATTAAIGALLTLVFGLFLAHQSGAFQP